MSKSVENIKTKISSRIHPFLIDKWLFTNLTYIRMERFLMVTRGPDAVLRKGASLPCFLSKTPRKRRNRINLSWSQHLNDVCKSMDLTNKNSWLKKSKSVEIKKPFRLTGSISYGDFPEPLLKGYQKGTLSDFSSEFSLQTALKWFLFVSHTCFVY